MNISSIVMHVASGHLSNVCSSLGAMPGVEIHAATKEGKVVLTIEDRNTRSASDSYIALHQVPGVLSVAMVYQFSDDESIANEVSA